ncbi:MAG: NAD(+) kinase [Epsilonproteobacteria bacterium]|nr:NAD(+) kinase [Campylobacterota bacterium]
MQIINTDEKIRDIKKIGLVLRPDTYNLHPYYDIIKHKCDLHGVKLLVSKESAKLLGVDGIDFDEMCEQSDLIICVGGDGTLISLSRRSYRYDKPILAINAGKLGFLTDINFEETDSFMDKLFTGEYRIDKRMVLNAIFISKGEKKSAVAFNDAVFSREMIGGMIKLKAYINGDHFNTYFGDGLIVSTPTGSTAYNLSSGGPVVYPLTEALILTPLCSHSLTQRPLILPVDFEVELKSEDNVLISLDGQENYNMRDFDSVKLKIASKGVKLIHRVERNYFTVLREKLNWGSE